MHHGLGLGTDKSRVYMGSQEEVHTPDIAIGDWVLLVTRMHSISFFSAPQQMKDTFSLGEWKKRAAFSHTINI
jgi:hypothetical protein